MAKNSDVKKTYIKAGLAGAECKFSNLGRALSESPRILPADDEQQKPRIFTSNVRAEILENTVRHVLKVATEAEGSTGMAVALGEIEGFARVVVDYLDDPANALRPQFVGIRRAVMLEGDCVAVAKSKTFAKRIANALNNHVPNREGV